MDEFDASIVDFEFDAQGDLIAVQVDDGWSSQVPVDQFGFQIMKEFTEQRARVMNLTQVDGPSVGPIPRAAADDLAAEAIAIIDAARTLLQRAKDEPAAYPDEVHTCHDARRRVIVTAQSGNITWIEINEPWLRQVDVSDLESTLLEALSQLRDTAPAHTHVLAELRQRHRVLVETMNDLRKG